MMMMMMMMMIIIVVVESEFERVDCVCLWWGKKRVFFRFSLGSPEKDKRMGACVSSITTSDAVMMYQSKSLAQSEYRYRVFKYDERVKGRDSHAKETFAKLGLNTNIIQCFFNYFNVIDYRKEESIDIYEFLDFFNLPKSRFTKRVFSLLDDDFEGVLDFEEFVVGLWYVFS